MWTKEIRLSKDSNERENRIFQMSMFEKKNLPTDRHIFPTVNKNSSKVTRSDAKLLNVNSAPGGKRGSLKLTDMGTYTRHNNGYKKKWELT